MAIVARYRSYDSDSGYIIDSVGENDLYSNGSWSDEESVFYAGELALVNSGSGATYGYFTNLGPTKAYAVTFRMDGSADQQVVGDDTPSRCQIFYSSAMGNLYIEFFGELATVEGFTVGDDELHTVVMQQDSGQLDIYVDNMTTPVLTTSSANTSNNPTAVRFQFSSLLDGACDVSIYDAVLSQGERDSLIAYGGAEEPDEDPEVSLSPATAGAFFLTLTGDADSVDDIVLPVSNLTARLRSGSDSYLAVTVPYTLAYAAAVSARPNGDLVLTYVDAAGAHEVVDVAFETPQVSRGTSSSSIVLTGHRQSTNSSPGSHEVAASAMQMGSTSTITRPGFDPDILPGDDVTAEDSTITANLVTLTASARRGGFNVQTIYSEGS